MNMEMTRGNVVQIGSYAQFRDNLFEAFRKNRIAAPECRRGYLGDALRYSDQAVAAAMAANAQAERLSDKAIERCLAEPPVEGIDRALRSAMVADLAVAASYVAMALTQRLNNKIQRRLFPLRL